MSTFRTIEPALFDNPVLIRLGLVAQWTFAYLIVKGADDEGRFEWDPFTICRNAFSPVDRIRPEHVAGVMDAMKKEKMLLRYARGACGFLTGWFEHQRITRAYRTPSKLPRPPVAIATWDEAEAARAAFCNETGADLKRTSYRKALRSISTASCEDLARTSQGPRKKKERFLTGGVEGEVDLDVPLPPTAVPPQAKAQNDLSDAASPVGADSTAQPKGPRPDTPQQTVIREAFGCLTGSVLPEKPKGYSGAAKLVSEHGIPKVRRWCDHLRTQPSGVPEGADPWAYFLTRLRRAMTRDFRWDPEEGAKQDVAGAGGNSDNGLSGWPPDPLRVTEGDADTIRAVARSPDWDRFPTPLHTKFLAPVYDLIVAEHEAYLAEVGA